MAERAVLFDLFGTLVAPFRRAEHQVAIADCAAQLGIATADCQRFWVESFAQRIRGGFGRVADNFAWIACQTGQHPLAPERLGAAEARYMRFTSESLTPVAGAVELLLRLRSRGLQIGLVTNCAPDVPQSWAGSAFADLVDVCAFSCQLGSVKPEPEIFHHALKRLGVPAERAWFVGDGSDRELTGAAACGMRPVLVANDLSNTYDAQRPEVTGWQGPVVGRLAEFEALLG